MRIVTYHGRPVSRIHHLPSGWLLPEALWTLSWRPSAVSADLIRAVGPRPPQRVFRRQRFS